MNLAVCQACRRKLVSLFYEPKFCRECRSEDVKVYSLVEWLAAAAISLLIIRALMR